MDERAAQGEVGASHRRERFAFVADDWAEISWFRTLPEIATMRSCQFNASGRQLQHESLLCLCVGER